MKKSHRSLMALPALALTVLLVHTPAAAQGFLGPIDGLRFTTDFSFVVNTVTFPAGTYSVRRIESNASVLELTNRLTLKMVLVPILAGNVPSHPPFDVGVTFERSGTAYVLGGFWDRNLGTAVDAVRPSHAEPREAGATQGPDHVLVRAIKR